MRTLGIAFAMALASCVGLFLLMSAIVAQREVALGVATLPFAAVSHVYETLERAALRSSGAVSAEIGIASFKGFGLPWFVIAPCGIAIVLGFMNAAVLLAYAIALVCVINGASFATGAAFIPISFPFSVAGAYLLGRWIGARCRSHGIPVVVAVSILGAFLAKAVDFLLLPDEMLKNLYGTILTGVVIQDYLVQAAGGSVFILIFAAFGYWRGRHNRVLKYFRYLLGAIPPATRETLLTMAYDEARTAHKAAFVALPQ